jgi:hypothetical protein
MVWPLSTSCGRRPTPTSCGGASEPFGDLLHAAFGADEDTGTLLRPAGQGAEDTQQLLRRPDED